METIIFRFHVKFRGSRFPSRDPGFLQVLEALKERRTLPVSNALAEMAVGRDPKKVGVRKGNPPLFYYGNPKPSFLGVITTTITHILGCKTFIFHGFGVQGQGNPMGETFAWPFEDAFFLRGNFGCFLFSHVASLGSNHA